LSTFLITVPSEVGSKSNGPTMEPRVIELMAKQSRCRLLREADESNRERQRRALKQKSLAGF